MANTLKELASTAQIVTQVALKKSLQELKSYIDTKDAADSAAIAQVQANLDALVGAGGDADKLLNTFNDIKNFLANYSEDDTLKSLIDAVNTAIGNEETRATTAEGALDARITTLENIHVMTAEEAQDIFDEVFGS